jgi:hypothetical protein
LWQQEEADGVQAIAGHSATTPTKNKTIADATTVRITYTSLL